jgi:hypothetical protein
MIWLPCTNISPTSLTHHGLPLIDYTPTPHLQAQRQQEKQIKAQRELFIGNLAPGTVTEQSLYQVCCNELAGVPGVVGVLLPLPPTHLPTDDSRALHVLLLLPPPHPQVFHSALIAAFPQAAQPGQEPVLKVGV